MKVLIVEDDDATRFFMSKAIRSRGHETMEAPDGMLGLLAFEEFHPDIVFTDINMPKMDGLEMLEKIRSTDSYSIVIINSTLDSPEYTLKALRLKANDYLIKPVLEKDLVALLEKYKEIVANRTKELEVLGMMSRREFDLEFPNRFYEIPIIVNRLMLETEPAIPLCDRLGVFLGLIEILTNSVEHGNLEITYEEKSALMSAEDDGWRNLIEKRSKMSPYMNRKIKIEFKMDKKRCEWVITDEGSGFDWKKIPDPNDPQNLLTALHGRGIMLARLQFDELEYLGNGNKVRLVKFLPGTAGAAV